MSTFSKYSHDRTTDIISQAELLINHVESHSAKHAMHNQTIKTL